MRRIYESAALRRDDDDPFAPGENDETERPQAMRSVPGGLLSRMLVPGWLRDRAVSVTVETPRETFPAGASVPFRVTMKNALPVPIAIPTRSPLLWTWTVDGLPEASHVAVHDPPDERRYFRFDRGERKQFGRRWSGSFRVSDSEWEPADPGEYTLAVALDVDDAAARGLTDETTVRIGSE